MRGLINIVAIDLRHKDTKLTQYYELTAIEKAKYLATMIGNAARELEKEYPHAVNIVVWREYGITDYDADRGDNRFITNDIKKQICELFEGLSKQYKSLIIIAGTMATLKKFERFTYTNFKAIESEYNSSYLSSIKKMESKLASQSSNPIVQATEKQIELHLSHISHFRDLAEEHKEPVKIAKNVSYVFHQGNTSKRTKTLPYFETQSSLRHAPEAIFRPGKQESQSPFFEFDHPHTNESFIISIEVCREHGFSYAKSHAKTDKMLPPLIQFVLSDSVHPVLRAMHGDFFCHLDSVLPPRLILNKKDTPANISFFNINHLTKTNTVNKLPDPAYSVEKELYTDIENLLAQISDKKSELYEALESIRMKFARAYGNGDDVFYVLRSELSDVEKAMPLDKSKTSLGFIHRIFSTTPKKQDIIAFIDKVKQLFDSQTEENTPSSHK